MSKWKIRSHFPWEMFCVRGFWHVKDGGLISVPSHCSDFIALCSLLWEASSGVARRSRAGFRPPPAWLPVTSPGASSRRLSGSLGRWEGLEPGTLCHRLVRRGKWLPRICERPFVAGRTCGGIPVRTFFLTLGSTVNCALERSPLCRKGDYGGQWLPGSWALTALPLADLLRARQAVTLWESSLSCLSCHGAYERDSLPCHSSGVCLESAALV